MHVHGTCSNCGGMVTTPTVWMGILPPTPTCQKCGAQAKQAHGPVIPMEPSKQAWQRVRPHGKF